MVKRVTFAVLLLSSTLSVAAQEIKLGKVYDNGLLYYDNGIVTIKIGYQDLKSELERLSNTDWYKSSSLNKNRVETQIKQIDRQIEQLKAYNFSVWKISDFTIKFSPDSVMIGLFRKTIGSSLLLEGKALVKYNNKDTEIISLTALSKENSIKFISKENELVFEGGIIK